MQRRGPTGERGALATRPVEADLRDVRVSTYVMDDIAEGLAAEMKLLLT
jgi:hypothetical protein